MPLDEELVESLSKGDVVTYSYTTEEGQEVSGQATVCKSNLGGIRLLPHVEEHRVAKRMLIVKDGHNVRSKNRDGGGARLTRSEGSHVSITPTGEQAGIKYVQHTGWVHVEGDA